MKIYKALITLFVGLCLASCSTWQEEQIDEKVVEIFLPRDSLVTDIATQLFYWYDVEGATKYELQVVTPSFERIDRLILDTNVARNQFEFTLQPGVYEWSLRAYNSSSSTGYTVYRLIIDSTFNLVNQKIVLVSPNDKDTSNRSEYRFGWQALYNATDYRFELYQPNVFGQLVHSENGPNNYVDYTPNLEGQFEWRVRGINNSSQTLFSAREFYADTTSPQVVTLSSPASNALLNTGDISFSWNQPAHSGAFTFDTLYVATDSSLTNIRRKFYSIDEQVTADTLSQGSYYWGVQSFDSAGNKGELNSSRKLTIQ